MFSSALPERLMGRMGKIHVGTPLVVKSRKELLETIKPHQRRYLRSDNGDLPEAPPPSPPTSQNARTLTLEPTLSR
jgi:hypothetical protein